MKVLVVEVGLSAEVRLEKGFRGRIEWVNYALEGCQRLVVGDRPSRCCGVENSMKGYRIGVEWSQAIETGL